MRRSLLVLAALVLTACGATTETPSASPKPPSASPVTPDEALFFAADAGAGAALTDPVDFGRVETRPLPMDIYVRREGGQVRRIIGTRAHERCPHVSPDGSRLAYLSDATVVVAPLRADGSVGAPRARVRVPKTDGHVPRLHVGVACPQWSPDGSRVGYVVLRGGTSGSFEEQRRGEIRALTPEGRDRPLISFRASPWASVVFAWSPDGDELAYTTERGVWRVALDGTAPHLVWRPKPGDPATMPMDHDQPIAVTWSARDELAVTVRSMVPVQEGIREDHTVLVVDVGSGRARQLGRLGYVDAGPAWSPDGSALAYVGTADRRVVVNDRADGSTRRLTVGLPTAGRVSVWDVAWSPAGDELLVLVRQEPRGLALVSMAPDASTTEVRTPWTWGFDWIDLDDVSWRQG